MPLWIPHLLKILIYKNSKECFHGMKGVKSQVTLICNEMWTRRYQEYGN